jgi:hypothetical protein
MKNANEKKLLERNGHGYEDIIKINIKKVELEA